jgi:acetyltransferase-like isoleucine patch superfamily enzyme
MQAALSVKAFFSVFTERILYLLSEFEAIALVPGTGAFWRKLYLKKKGVEFQKQFYIGKGFWIQFGNNFRMGKRCSLGEFARIIDHTHISIGDDFIAATGLQINNGRHDPISMRPGGSTIQIGDRVWCGANVTIVAGAEIGDDVVIGAGSLVRTKIPANSVAVGVPAKVIRRLERPDTQKIWRLFPVQE